MQPLSPDALYHHCDLSLLSFTDSSELPPLDALPGQERAREAIDFGVGMAHPGYNLFVTGALGVGKHSLVTRLVGERAAAATKPGDCCYVHDFEQPARPRSLSLPGGDGRRLQREMQTLVEQLLDVVPATFQGEDYQNRLQEIHDELQSREKQGMEELVEKARGQGIALLRTPMGFTLGPMQDGKLLGPEEFNKLPEARRHEIERVVEGLNEELRQLLQRMPRLQEENRSRIKALNREFAHVAVDPLLQGLQQRWQEHTGVLAWLESLHEHLLENLEAFFRNAEKDGNTTPSRLALEPEYREYRVNVLVDHGETEGAPLIYEDNPTFQNLIGRIEHQAQFGMLTTDFTLIRPGALHRANGGYLILDARKLLTNPFAWEGLKRALRAGELRIESLEDVLSLTRTTSLEPEPVPLDVKVVLCGERMLYLLLQEYDPEFSQLFKVQADFSEELTRAPQQVALYARLIADIARREQLPPLDRDGVARVIEHSSRMVDDAQKLSLNVMRLTDLLRESAYWARDGGNGQVRAADVRRALERRRYRHGQVREQLREQVARELVMIATTGESIGQANGLAVFRVGEEWFGRPGRISATARVGGRGVVDIERETRLGGPIHSKGVLILGSYIAQRFARDLPLSVSASLVFEQSYGMVDGDSASAVELCVLLSAIGGLPLAQRFAVTGSVNQHGAIQAIGGVNEKIEGYFDVCVDRGLDGGQGVIIPAANTQHLMLREDVVEAVREGRFTVHAVRHIDELLALLTGLPAGEADASGRFPEGSANAAVQQQLERWHSVQRAERGDGAGAAALNGGGTRHERD